jgi:uncharacterized cupin superfamily protein
VPHPVVFAVPADTQLDPAPLPADWIIEGRPEARAKRLATSPDGAAAIIAWSCSPGRFRWHYAVDEILHLISGEVVVTDEKGESRRLGPGDMAYFPAGSRSVWHVIQEVKKLAICRQSVPRPVGLALRAWNKLAAMLAGPAEDEDALEGKSAVVRNPERVTAA